MMRERRTARAQVAVDCRGTSARSSTDRALDYGSRVGGSSPSERARQSQAKARVQLPVGVHRLSRFACRRSPRARVPARRFSLAGVRKARPPTGSAVPVGSLRLALGAPPCAPGRWPCFAALAASSRSARSAAAELPGQHRHPAAHPGQGFFERLGLQGSSLVFRSCFAPPTLVDHPGTSAPAVLADVFVPRAPDPGFELDGCVFVERGEFGRLGLGHQQSLGVGEDRYQGRIHLSSSIPPPESSG